MGRAISVKVPKAKVVSALKARLENNKIVVASNEQKEKNYQADLKVFNNTMIKEYQDLLIVDSIHTRWNNEIQVTYKKVRDFELDEPKRPDKENELGRYELDEIENAIRILDMSDEEYVNATTMKQIASYL